LTPSGLQLTVGEMSFKRELRVATHQPDVRPALRGVRFLDDVKSEALLERDVALRTGLKNHSGTARLLNPELDERGADPSSLQAGSTATESRCQRGSGGIFEATHSQKSS
jgi:hypothetical protein